MVFEKKSALMLSATLKRARVAEVLLENGADPNYCTKAGSALHFAAEEDNDHLMFALLADKRVRRAYKD